MTFRLIPSTFAVLLVIGTQAGCALTNGSVAPPFDKMTQAPMTVYRLQNFEAPAAAAPGIQLPAGLNLPPGLQLPQLAEMGNNFLKQMGLPAVLPGAPGAGSPQDARFPTQPPPGQPTYRVLQYKQVADPALQKEIATLFGTHSNFTNTSDNCMYPELGFAIQNPQGGVAEIIVSAGCKQVRGYNFQWPYPEQGVQDAALRELGEIVTKVFAGA